MERRTSVSPGPEGLRALAHPARLRILGMLRNEGPATATTLAERLGLNSGATSYHVRQLAAHGFVVDDPERGTGRERWWRAAHQSTRTEIAPLPPEEADTADAYLQAVAFSYADNLNRALAEVRSLPRDWQDAMDLSDWSPRVTPANAKRLVEAVHAVIEDWPEDEGPEAGAFTLNVNAFLRPGTLR